MQVNSLTVEELTDLIRKTVVDTMQSVLNDPDYGLQMKSEVEQRLVKSLAEAQSGQQKGASLSEVAQRLELTSNCRY